MYCCLDFVLCYFFWRWCCVNRCEILHRCDYWVLKLLICPLVCEYFNTCILLNYFSSLLVFFLFQWRRYHWYVWTLYARVIVGIVPLDCFTFCERSLCILLFIVTSLPVSLVILCNTCTKKLHTLYYISVGIFPCCFTHSYTLTYRKKSVHPKFNRILPKCIHVHPYISLCEMPRAFLLRHIFAMQLSHTRSTTKCYLRR